MEMDGTRTVGWEEVDRVTVIDRKRKISLNEAKASFSLTIPSQSGPDHGGLRKLTQWCKRATRLEPAGTQDLILTLTPSCAPLSPESHQSSRQADYMNSWEKLGKEEKLTTCLFLLKEGCINLQR